MTIKKIKLKVAILMTYVANFYDLHILPSEIGDALSTIGDELSEILELLDALETESESNAKN